MSRTRNSKYAARVASVAGLVVVAMASAAFACTDLRGEITMTGVNGTTGSVTYGGKGAGDTVDAYCTTPTTRAPFTPLAPGAPTVPGAALTFRLDVEAANPCPPAIDPGGLENGVYEVRWIEAAGETPTLGVLGAPNCHGLPDEKTRWIVLGEMRLEGTGSGTFALPANPVADGPATTVGPGNICLQLIAPTGQAQQWAPPVIFMKWNTV